MEVKPFLTVFCIWSTMTFQALASDKVKEIEIDGTPFCFEMYSRNHDLGGLPDSGTISAVVCFRNLKATNSWRTGGRFDVRFEISEIENLPDRIKFELRPSTGRIQSTDSNSTSSFMKAAQKATLEFLSDPETIRDYFEMKSHGTSHHLVLEEVRFTEEELLALEEESKATSMSAGANAFQLQFLQKPNLGGRFLSLPSVTIPFLVGFGLFGTREEQYLLHFSAAVKVAWLSAYALTWWFDHAIYRQTKNDRAKYTSTWRAVSPVRATVGGLVFGAATFACERLLTALSH